MSSAATDTTTTLEGERAELARIKQELEVVRAQAAQESNFKSRFLANMSHELRTPLNAIIGFSELLEQEIAGKLTTTQKEYVLNVLTSGQHLLELINDILDLSKIEAGRMDLRFTWQSLTTVIDAVAGSIEALAKKRGVTFTIEISPEVPDLFIDLVRLRQILFNLLSNAVKFTPPGGEVTLTARKRGKFVLIAVRDTGIGIRAGDLPRLFREFEQIHTMVTTEGTGLGLALTQKLVELHGGEITVESVEAQGSTFTVQLPVLRPSSGGAVASTLDVDTPPGSLVLVIEDDAKAAELLTSHLASAGVTTVCTSDAETALEQARTIKPAAITIDLRMPGVDGWAILARLKSEPETELIPVVVVSVVEEPNRALLLGAVDHLVKPVSRDVLLDSLEGVGVQLFRISGLRVMLIGGLDDRLDGYERTLRACGCEVIRAAEPSRDILRRSPKPNLVIFDLAAEGEADASRRAKLLEEAASAYIAVVAVIPDEADLATNWGVLNVLRQQEFGRQDRLVRCVWSAAHEPRTRPSRLPPRRGDT